MATDHHEDETQAQPSAKGQSAAVTPLHWVLAPKELLNLVLPQFPHLPWERCLRYFLLYGLLKAKCTNAWEWSCVFFLKRMQEYSLEGKQLAHMI